MYWGRQEPGPGPVPVVRERQPPAPVV